MDNAQKAIMLGVGLFITIIVIAAVMAITGIGQDLLNQGQSQLAGISGQLATQVQAQYDQVRMSGTQVRAAVNKYYNDGSLAVYVITQLPTDNFTLETAPQDYDPKTTGSTGSPFCVSMVYFTDDTMTSTNYGVNFSGLTSSAGGTLETNSKQPALADITKNITSTAQYKSGLITNSKTGAIVGIVFQRYQ